MRTKKRLHGKPAINKKHFQKRMVERQGIDATNAIISDIVAQVQDPKCETFVSRQSNTRSLHRVLVHGREILIVYCHTTKLPKTTLLEGKVAELLGYGR